jgi:hypothetical protein
MLVKNALEITFLLKLLKMPMILKWKAISSITHPSLHGSCGKTT